MEMWDLYDKNEVKTGLSITKRFGDIPAGYFHIVVETLVKHTDGTYLVMQRDFNKKESPGVYEGSAGGSILAGETKVDGAIREVLEETGLHVKHIEPTYYFVNEAKGVINQGYLALVDDPSKKIVYQPGETINHQWLTLEELKAFIKTPAYNPNHYRRLMTYLDTINEA